MATECCIALLKTLVFTIVDSIKALLPVGILPRKSVAGEIVLITGSGSGIGRLMALEFAKLGARLVLWDLNEKQNQETAKQVQDLGAEAHAYTINLVNRKEIYAIAETVKKEVGDVDILINNAGIVTGKKLLDTSDEMIDLTMSVNCTSHFFTVKAFLAHMLEMNHGHIVTISSMAGLTGIPYLVDYCASKHGAIGFSSALAAELSLMDKDGIHVTTICPFFIKTGMFDGVQNKSPVMFPIMTPEFVVDRIMDSILTNQPIIYLPKSCYIAVFLSHLLPTSAAKVLEKYLGATDYMHKFIGRAKQSV